MLNRLRGRLRCRLKQVVRLFRSSWRGVVRSIYEPIEARQHHSCACIIVPSRARRPEVPAGQQSRGSPLPRVQSSRQRRVAPPEQGSRIGPREHAKLRQCRVGLCRCTSCTRIGCMGPRGKRAHCEWQPGNRERLGPRSYGAFCLLHPLAGGDEIRHTMCYDDVYCRLTRHAVIANCPQVTRCEKTRWADYQGDERSPWDDSGVRG